MSYRTLVPSFLLLFNLTWMHAVPVAHASGTELLDELRQLARESREKQAADRWLQRALDELVARYDRPWKRDILFEDFSDGDYTRNPAWTLLQGRFDVRREQGLIASADPTSQRTGVATGGTQAPQADLAGALVGALLDQAFGPKPAPQRDQPQAISGEPNRLRVQANVSNAFSLTASARLGTDAVLEIALLQSQSASYGYRLVIDTGGRGTIELQRIRKGRAGIVASQPLSGELGDGGLHDITWQQTPAGEVSVLIDQKPVFTLTDRAFRDPYPWLELRHDAGELTLRSIRIQGT